MNACKLLRTIPRTKYVIIIRLGSNTRKKVWNGVIIHVRVSVLFLVLLLPKATKKQAH